MPTIDAMPIQDRLAYGKAKEDAIRKCLNEHYKSKGYNLHPASFVQDCKEKTDCWHVTKDGRKLRCAIKARDSRNDILAAIREPFYGVNDEETQIGRDMRYEYKLYITLSKCGKIIRVAKGKRCHEIYNEMYEEWVAKIGGEIEVARMQPGCILHSEIHPRCQLWFHRDRWNGRPKILGFIPPDYLKAGKEIEYYPLIEG